MVSRRVNTLNRTNELWSNSWYRWSLLVLMNKQPLNMERYGLHWKLKGLRLER